MAEKDLLEIIADMLRKLDQHSEILKKQGETQDLNNERLRKQGESLDLHSEALTTFMDGSLKQFDQQLIINEKLIGRLEVLEAKMDRS